MSNPSRHADDRNWLESLGRSIPGFKGYLEKEYRRDSDFLARKQLADRLQRAKPSLDTYMRNLVDSAQLDGLTQCERVRTRVDGLINTIRSAERGYSGIFDYVKVKQDLLDQVYQGDMALLSDVNAAADAIEALATTSDSPTIAIPPVLKQIDEVDRLFQKRGDLLKGLGPDVPA
ncbi:MAG TPA: hypothetical protein VL096_13795 [Pirellulaceae bacterium]|nr:hypothetical protein [Pirellulaceae bacterium]